MFSYNFLFFIALHMIRILLSTDHSDCDTNNEYLYHPSMRTEYYEFLPLIESWAIPLIVPPAIYTQEDINDLVQSIDKIVIMWWQDVDPLRYGESVLFDNVKRYWMRDDVEIKLLNAATTYKKPVLWICRGMQILNVAHWWTLYQNIKEQLKTTCLHMQNDHFSLSHRIQSVSWFLSIIWFWENDYINTFHNQAVKNVASWFRVCATSEDWVIEAIENTEKKQYGVQRHPEISRRFDQRSKDLINRFISL